MQKTSAIGKSGSWKKVGSVKKSLTLLQKMFQLFLVIPRPGSDSRLALRRQRTRVGTTRRKTLGRVF